MHSASMLSKGDCLSICLYVCPSQSRSIYMQQCVWSGCTYNTSSLTQTFWCYKVPTVTKDVGNKHRLGAITYDFWWISYCLAKMTQDRAIDRGIWLNTQICIVLKNHDVFVWNMYWPDSCWLANELFGTWILSCWHPANTCTSRPRDCHVTLWLLPRCHNVMFQRGSNQSVTTILPLFYVALLGGGAALLYPVHPSVCPMPAIFSK